MQGFAATFSDKAPVEALPANDPNTKEAQPLADPYGSHPLRDPALYPGGEVPGFSIDRIEHEDY